MRILLRLCLHLLSALFAVFLTSLNSLAMPTEVVLTKSVLLADSSSVTTTMIEESVSTSGGRIGSSEACLGLVKVSHDHRVGIPKRNCGIWISDWTRNLYAAKGGTGFASDAKLLEHFGQHGAEFGAKNANEYLQIGKDIMQNGQKVEYLYKEGEIRTGYVQFMENSSKNGTAKFGFVGTNADGAITTIHVESGNSFWKMLNNGNLDKVIKPVS